MYKQRVYFKHMFMESETSPFACHILMCPFHQLTETASRNLPRKWQLANSKDSWRGMHPFRNSLWKHLDSLCRWVTVTPWPCQGCWRAAGSKHHEQDFHRHGSRCPAGLGIRECPHELFLFEEFPQVVSLYNKTLKCFPINSIQSSMKTEFMNVHSQTIK